MSTNSDILFLKMRGSDPLRKVSRIVFLVIILLVVAASWNSSKKDESSLLFIGNKEIKIDERISKSDAVIEKKDKVSDAKEGLAATIGQTETKIKQLFGEPMRIDPSSYGYDWWIYNQSEDHYFQLAIEDGKVVSAYGIGDQVNVAPFKIGQPMDEVYANVSAETFVDIKANGSSYRFELSEEDMNMRPIIILEGVYAQLYLDKFTGMVSSIRFLNDRTLLKHRPYELTYRGELLPEEEVWKQEWAEIEAGTEQQIFDISNIMRKRFSVSALKWDESTAKVAYLHSLDMFNHHYFSHVSRTEGDLADRLKAGRITYSVAGENIAANYIDSIAVTEGWLNSKGHREALLNEEFTHLGVGVYQKYYTQNFIAK